ncbi:hypothetical protein CDL12_17156 [Handroanthus impetiginosus]|uniref:Uncharacterized protein n=1 Tax=Handroanthus impetiginosus TaxID=429701 RepID=A0A2G9GYG5_9LAMI|nr:hypothetical protein CDL12_17156 [Handroanthus impetiginosus]
MMMPVYGIKACRRSVSILFNAYILWSLIALIHCMAGKWRSVVFSPFSSYISTRVFAVQCTVYISKACVSLCEVRIMIIAYNFEPCKSLPIVFFSNRSRSLYLRLK